MRGSRSATAVGLGTLLTLLAAAPGGAAEPFEPGTATALSQALQVGPSTAGLQAVMTVARSQAQYRGSLAIASGQVLDTGAIGTVLTAEQCDGSDPVVSREQLPQPVSAESDGTRDDARTHDTAGLPGGMGLLGAAGHIDVRATKRTRADSRVDTGALEVPGLMVARGLASDATAELVDGRARLARASSGLGRLELLGGQVVLSDLRWEAVQRTGEDPAVQAAFRVGSGSVLGVPLPSAPTGGADLSALDEALEPTGLKLQLPEVLRTNDGGVEVTPLTVGIADSALGAAVFGPVLGAAQPVREAVTGVLLGISCKFGSVLSIADLGLGGFTGAGSLELRLGGATAGSEGRRFDNPFGSGGGRLPEVPAVAAAPPLAVPPAAAQPATPVLPAPAAVPVAAPVAAAPVLLPTAATRTCSTTSPAGWPSCSGGRALLAGAIGLVVLLLLAGADARVLRHRRTPSASL